MLSETLIRKSLWATVPFNLLGAVAFALPGSLPGRLIQVPAAPPIQSLILGFMILLFGLMYAWITMQPTINRPMLMFGAVGKIGVFLIGAALLLTERVAPILVLGLVGDLAFGSLWMIWLLFARESDEA